MGKVVVGGAAGFIGKALVRRCREDGDEVVALVRSPQTFEAGIRPAIWDGKSPGAWAEELEGARAVVNLAGVPVTLKWTEENRRRIVESRVQSAQAIGEAIRACAKPPKVWVNASAVGFYGDRGDEVLTERSTPGTGFLADVCRRWEAAVEECETPGTRKVWIRTGVVLGRGGGAFEPLAKLTRLFLGGAAGDGAQWMPWIHLEDLVDLYRWCFEADVAGPVNGSAPEPARNRDFLAALRQAAHRPWSPPVPALALSLVGHLFGPDPSVLLDSDRVIPELALSQGFEFRHRNLGETLRELV